jgi:hypothetical protein
MTKQFEPDVFAAKAYQDSIPNKCRFLNEALSHEAGQRHAASVLIPEIERLEKALEESKAIAQKHEGWLMQEICVRGGLDEKVEGLTKALDLTLKGLMEAGKQLMPSTDAFDAFKIIEIAKNIRDGK